MKRVTGLGFLDVVGEEKRLGTEAEIAGGHGRQCADGVFSNDSVAPI